MTLASRARETAARVLWRAHPARPRPELGRIEESQWWSPEQLRTLQAEQLRSLGAAAGKVPFYRERFLAAGLGAGGPRDHEELARLPALRRQDLHRLGVDGLRVDGGRGLRANSTGSTGKPVEVIWSLPQMRWLDANEERGRLWLGVELGERRLEVRCRPVGRPQAISAAATNTTAVHAPSVADPAYAQRLAESLSRRPPALVHGVSNAIYRVALALREQDVTVRAKACWSGGNHLHPHYRAALEAAFACPVYERYATIETGLVAHECAEGRSLHVPAEGTLVEIVGPDGEPAAPGETGEVLVTCLRNSAMPLIRYAIGDVAAAPESSSCSCGRGLPVFGRVVGRSSDTLRSADGEVVTPAQVVDAVTAANPGLIDLQVIQDGDARLRVLVVQRDSPPPEPERERIAAALAALVRPPEEPRIERVESIPLTPGGKVRTVVAEEPVPAPAAR